MPGRLLLGVIAALRAVLIPGQVELLTTQPLAWPHWRLPRFSVPSMAAVRSEAAELSGDGAVAVGVLLTHGHPASPAGMPQLPVNAGELDSVRPGPVAA